MTVLNHTQNCTADYVMLLLLELQQVDGKADSVYLDACLNGMNTYQFWNYLACSTLTEGGGREAQYMGCKPKEILYPEDPSSTALPNWVTIVWSMIAVVVTSVLLALCVAAYQCYHHRARRPIVQIRYIHKMCMH